MTNPNTAPSAAQPYAIDGVVYAIARKDQREAYVMFDTPAQANGFVEYMRRFIEKPEVASRDAGGAASGGQGEPQKYDDVLVPFVAAMRKELHANTRKGDRPGWLTMDANTALLEVYWHAAKLSAAVKNNDGPAIQEHSADVANMAMMVLDICGGLAWVDVEPVNCGCGVTCEDRMHACRYRIVGTGGAADRSSIQGAPTPPTDKELLDLAEDCNFSVWNRELYLKVVRAALGWRPKTAALSAAPPSPHPDHTGSEAVAPEAKPNWNERSHLAHCFQGEFLHSCKYGDDECPAAPPAPPAPLSAPTAPADHGAAEPVARDLNDTDMDAVLVLIDKLNAGDLGFHGFCDAIIALAAHDRLTRGAPADLSDDMILHRWDTHVGLSGVLDADKLAFARAVLYEARRAPPPPHPGHTGGEAVAPEAKADRAVFEQWYDAQPDGKLSPWDVWQSAIQHAIKSGHACTFALDNGGNLYRRYKEPQCAPPAPPAPPDRAQRSGVSADPLPLTDTYVQPVPDKCDRITWRGQYYHLPVSSQSQPLVDPQAVTIFNALDEAAQTILGEETRNNVREWLRRAWHHNVCPAIAASPQHQVKKGESSSLFQCQVCGCAENTALASQGCDGYAIKFFDWTGIEDRKGKKLCSVCAPMKYSDGAPTAYGKWHDRFTRTFLPLGMFVTNDKGNLAHRETGDENYRGYALVGAAAQSQEGGK